MILRNKPVLPYCGITFILSNPGRFDKVNLLSSDSGNLMNDCLYPEFNTMQCDLRVMEDESPFLDGTRVVVCLGEHSMWQWIKDTKSNSLNEVRGCPYYINNIPALATFFPQDAADIATHEQEINVLSKEYTGAEGEYESEDSDEGDVKRHSATSRSNYYFWIKADIRKCKTLLRQTTSKWQVEPSPVFRIYPDINEVINELDSHSDDYLYFDIENDFDFNILCFSFAFWPVDSEFKSSDLKVYSIPFLDCNYHLAYPTFSLIWRALIGAIERNIVVGQNIAAHDLPIMAFRFNIPFRRAQDTMLMQHRIFPDVEKSLGHLVSYWTLQGFHKDTSAHGYFTPQMVYDECKYCAKDVFTTALVHQAQLKYIPTVPGLKQSVDLVNRSIRPYTICTLTGMRYSKEKVDKISAENDILIEQYARIVDMLIGPIGVEHCKSAVKSNKASFIAGSTAQCVDYFHTQMEYEVQKRSKKTGKPLLGKKQLFNLALQIDNPVIKFVLLYRLKQKEYSMLQFLPWKDDDNKIIRYEEV